MRPELSFDWPIIGHKKIKGFLQRGVLGNNFAHAYIFCGPAKTGKTLTARTFAQTILCENYKKYLQASSFEADKLVVPCGLCNSCKQFKSKVYADLYVVEREINEKTGKKKNALSVAQIRDLLEKISKRAFLNSYKIVLIPEAQLLNQEASNCLLKTLEEPTPRTIIILMTPNKELLLPTILSRCQSLKFLPVTNEEIYQYLLGRGANRSLALELASVAEGRPTVAMKFFAEPEKFQSYKQENTEMLQIFNSGIVKKFKFVEKLAENNKQTDALMEKLNHLSGLSRDLLLIANYKNELVVNPYLIEELKKISDVYDCGKIVGFIQRIEETKKLIKENINARFALENLIIDI